MPGARSDQRAAPHRRPESANIEHFPYADESAGKPRPCEHAELVRTLRAHSLNRKLRSERDRERSGADVPGVEGARHGGILGALEDGAAVSENGHFIRRNPEAKQKIVQTHVVDERPQSNSENGEVESAGAFVNLHGITTAHGDAGLGFSFKIGEIAPGASAALGIARHTNGLHATGPDVAREQAPMKSLGAAGEEFQACGAFQRGNQIDDRPGHTDVVAGFLEALSSGTGFEKASEAGRGAGTNSHGQPVAGNGGRVDSKPGGLYANNVG